MNAGVKYWAWSGLAGGALVLGLSAPLARVQAGEVPATPPPPAAGANEQQAQKLLEEQAAQEKRAREEIAAQAQAQFETGRQLFASFEYEEARRALDLAVQLDRTNEEARKLLVRVNDILGQRRERIKAAAASLYGEEKVKIQERLVELDTHLDWAKRYVEQAERQAGLTLTERIRAYEQALTSLERARELVKWMPVEVNVEEQSNEINRLTSNSRRAIKALEAQLQATNRQAAEELARQQVAREIDLARRRINALVDQARAASETGKYDLAVQLSNKILETDPSNPEANAIIASARDQYHEKREKWIKEEQDFETRRNNVDIDRRSVPISEYLVYPDNWSEINKRSVAATGQAARIEEPWKQDIRKKLARRVSFDFVETPLSDVIQFMNTLTKVTVILDSKAGDVAKTPITLHVADMDMEQALKWVLRLAELEYDLRKQAIFITKKEQLNTNLELKIYDIRDLTTTITDFPGPEIDVGAAANNTTLNPFATPSPVPPVKASDLAEMIKGKLLQAEFADPATAIEEQNGQLVVTQRPEIQDRIAALLKDFRETQTIQVLTQVRFIDVNEDFLETIGIHFEGLDAPVGDTGVANALVNKFQQPSRWGIFPNGGGPGLASPLPSDIESSPNFQFQNFIPQPPFIQQYGPGTPNPGPAPITMIHPRLDANFPNQNSTTSLLSLAPSGIRRQWYSSILGSNTLAQGLTQNILPLNPLASVLGSSMSNSPAQGALFQFRFLGALQTNAILQAIRKDENSNMLLAPRLVQFNLQRAHMAVEVEHSYIQTYTISGNLYDPIVSAYITGVVLDLKPTVSNDRRYITLDLHPSTADEVTPPATIYITNGNDVNNPNGSINLPIQLPNLELKGVNTTVTIPDNGTMLFSGMISDNKFDAKSGVPFFSDLPIIGRLFCTNNKERVRRNLLIMVNSRIIMFDEEEAKL